MKKNKKTLRLKLIANPGAGDVAQATLKIELVTHYLMDAGFNVEVALAKPKKEAIPIAKKAVKDGFDVIVAMGGDGTIGAVIRGMAGSKVKLGIIGAGTYNDMATSLGIPVDLQQACDLIASGHTRKLDLGQIKTGNKKIYFFNVAAVGLLATIFPDIKNLSEGNFSGVKAAISKFLTFNSKPVVYLTLDDNSKIKVETMLVTIANTPLAGAKNLIAPNASLEDGLLDISVYPDFSKGELLAYFAQSANERNTPDGKIQRFQAKKIKIKSTPKLGVAAEGDLYLGKGTARIKVLPGALWVLAPEPGDGVEKTRVQINQSIPSPEDQASK